MPAVHFTDPDGRRYEVDGVDKQSVMQVAVNNDIPGIEGECGGEMNCGTCHVYVDADWFSRLSDIEPDEEDMLDFVNHRRPTSRLGCQIRLSSELDGLSLIVAEP